MANFIRKSNNNINILLLLAIFCHPQNFFLNAKNFSVLKIVPPLCICTCLNTNTALYTHTSVHAYEILVKIAKADSGKTYQYFHNLFIIITILPLHCMYMESKMQLNYSFFQEAQTKIFIWTSDLMRDSFE